jgi:hypothetical protein
MPWRKIASAAQQQPDTGGLIRTFRRAFPRAATTLGVLAINPYLQNNADDYQTQKCVAN